MSEILRISTEVTPLPRAADARSLTRFHQRLWAEELTGKASDGQARVMRALSEAKVDLNPHQLEAAVFAIDSTGARRLHAGRRGRPRERPSRRASSSRSWSARASRGFWCSRRRRCGRSGRPS
jgi:hypothetical protein